MVGPWDPVCIVFALDNIATLAVGRSRTVFPAFIGESRTPLPFTAPPSPDSSRGGAYSPASPRARVIVLE